MYPNKVKEVHNLSARLKAQVRSRPVQVISQHFSQGMLPKKLIRLLIHLFNCAHLPCLSNKFAGFNEFWLLANTGFSCKPVKTF